MPSLTYAKSRIYRGFLPYLVTRMAKNPSSGRSVGKNRMQVKQEQEAVIDRAIGAKLRALYDEVAREPVPDRFVELLKQLDDKK